MDPAAGVSTPTDPAGYAVLLLEHRSQLQRLSAATEAIRTRLQLNPPVSSVSTAASSASQPSPAAAAADCASDPTPAHTPGPLMALPDEFSGDPEQCVGFLMQCELFLRQQSSLYPTEETMDAPGEELLFWDPVERDMARLERYCQEAERSRAAAEAHASPPPVPKRRSRRRHLPKNRAPQVVLDASRPAPLVVPEASRPAPLVVPDASRPAPLVVPDPPPPEACGPHPPCLRPVGFLAALRFGRLRPVGSLAVLRIGCSCPVGLLAVLRIGCSCLVGLLAVLRIGCSCLVGLLAVLRIGCSCPVGLLAVLRPGCACLAWSLGGACLAWPLDPPPHLPHRPPGLPPNQPSLLHLGPPLASGAARNTNILQLLRIIPPPTRSPTPFFLSAVSMSIREKPDQILIL
ncbi:actin cytoskeleton-regulatory complex protein pan1-like [Oryzias melastigma]|uniref:actin cytoskeleton-regulatory complex protein pan1-like n=1 Tax=Oryzias melastigma TaxID=30732 RepID=UPI00168CD26E|nr:actin cytoskeleton-regulatory complex protein pan1-like [Oryzias melastigma]